MKKIKFKEKKKGAGGGRSGGKPRVYEYGEGEAMVIMTSGTELGQELVERLMSPGPSVLGMGVAVYGLAMATQMYGSLLKAKGYDFEGMMDTVKARVGEVFNEAYCKELMKELES